MIPPPIPAVKNNNHWHSMLPATEN
jgi:hypothetical protein